jgi:hypothetical protein
LGSAHIGPERTSVVEHPRLGTLRLNADENWWEARVTLGERTVVIGIGGDTTPDGRLIEHAVDIVEGFDAFTERVERFLETEAAKMPEEIAEEVSALVLDGVYLFWPKRPNDGMLYFEGPDQYRVWRCDYIDRLHHSIVVGRSAQRTPSEPGAEHTSHARPLCQPWFGPQHCTRPSARSAHV